MMTIGSLSGATRVKIETIRYYERVGLLPAPTRTAGGRRQYDRNDERRLNLIKHSRELGFGMPAIRKILELIRHPDAPCAEVVHIVEEQLAAVDERIKRLMALRKELTGMADACGSGNRMAECQIIESISA